MADAKPDDIKDLLGGALFRALYKWMEETGPVYLLPTGRHIADSWTTLNAWRGCADADCIELHP